MVRYTDLGFQVGVDLKPYAGVTLSAIDCTSLSVTFTFSLSSTTANQSTANTGACKDDPDHHEFGVQLAPAAGVALEADAAWADNTASPFAQVTIVVSWRNHIYNKRQLLTYTPVSHYILAYCMPPLWTSRNSNLSRYDYTVEQCEG